MAKDETEEAEEDEEETEDNGNNPEKKPELEKNVIGAEIIEEMEKSYIDYAMSVIVARALPSVEDGLKPVHRRILYSMYAMGLKPGSQTRKCARIVGDVLGKFHPHGDLAVYDSLVRMAQDFTLRYPLVHGQGNFGCFTSDTKVALADGRALSFAELIKENQEGKRNFTFAISDGNIKIAEIKNPRKTKENAEIMKVVLDNGEEIKCTLNHKFMLRDGSYKEAKDLKPLDSLMPLYNGICLQKSIRLNHKVARIEFLNEFVDVYDLTIDQMHNFALACGIFVHNSIDNDPAAAQRYTEAKLSNIAMELLEDLDKDTVKFVPNFDNTMKEPETLPAKLPNLLINGSSGIAVGMATNIPPHNLTEVCDAVIKYIENPEITVEKLAEIIRGPDFPTGGVISGNFVDIYKTGKGRVILRGKLTTEERKGREAIVITEIPYMVNKSDLVSEIARLAQEKKLQEISDVRDESARGKIRVVVELRKGMNSKFVINKLYKYTRLQDNFDVNLLALVKGKPQILDLKKFVSEYSKHRESVVEKRTKFDLKNAEDRLEIVRGLLIALKDIDAVIDLIKKAANITEAKEKLTKKYSLSIKQAEAILEIKLSTLTHLEQDKLKKEEQDLKSQIEELKKILSSEKEILNVVRKEVLELRRKYGDERKTQVAQRELKELEEKDLIQKTDVIVTITDKGYAKRMDVKTYKEQKRGGKGMIGSDLSTGDFVKQLLTCSTHDYLLFFTSKGKVYWLKAYEVPAAERYSKGKALVNMLNLKDETVQSVLAVSKFENYLIFVTKQGIVKKLALQQLSNPRASGVRAINLPMDNSDTLIDVKPIVNGQEVMLITADGQAIRFNSDEVREMGRSSYGVTGIKLEKQDEVVSLEILPIEKEKKPSILTITAQGYGKRSEIEDYRLTGRACKGVINLKVTDKTGRVVTSVSVTDKDSIVVTTAKGIVIRTNVKEIRVMGRATQGVRIIKLHDDDKVTDLAKLHTDEDLDSVAKPEENQKTPAN